MTSLINESRPPVFCPGCSHERVLYALDQAFQSLGLEGREIVMVSDIGCSGLFDTFFNTHALHGLHGRALTYAAGLKLAQPDLNVVVTMGDGGLGIGGAHVLSACRRNLDLTLLVLNNFNFGMTGGQASVTTPVEAEVASGFLNRLEKPMDVAQVAAAAGAGFVAKVSAYQKGLPDLIKAAITYDGFAVVEVQGVCPGRYTRRNRLNPKMIDEALAQAPAWSGPVPANQRPEYGQAYRRLAQSLKPAQEPRGLSVKFKPPQPGRQEVVILGSAGQRVITAGELLGLAGLSAGLQVTQKNEYDITVLRGPSISELILSPEPIDYASIDHPTVVLALAREGVGRFAKEFPRLDSATLVIRAQGVDLPETGATVHDVDLKGQGLKNADWSLAGLSVQAQLGRAISLEMLRAALAERFRGQTLEEALALIERVKA
ncbi:MAG: thiamine pyrophosphate-dependent enzyme [Thermodesulfobacteriota bacterium]